MNILVNLFTFVIFTSFQDTHSTPWTEKHFRPGYDFGPLACTTFRPGYRFRSDKNNGYDPIMGFDFGLVRVPD